MKISREAQRKARKLFDASLVDGQLNSEKALAVAEIIIKSKPRHFFQILKEFTRLTRIEFDRHTAIIESAAPLDEASLESIAQALKSRDAQVTITTSTNSSLIGGTKIQLGSDVWDGTVLARLESIKSAS